MQLDKLKKMDLIKIHRIRVEKVFFYDDYIDLRREYVIIENNKDEKMLSFQLADGQFFIQTYQEFQKDMIDDVETCIHHRLTNKDGRTKSVVIQEKKDVLEDVE
jgi:hypothetical protein